jgi:SET domain-containing protein
VGRQDEILISSVSMNPEIDHLFVSYSTSPCSGFGLFTNKTIEKGSLIIEYTGEITTWDTVKQDSANVYIYFVDEDYVIDAKKCPEAIARYANDANGPTRISGVDNNSAFENVAGKIFIKATNDIPAGSEILVSYGDDYWETVKKNSELKKTRDHKQ